MSDEMKILKRVGQRVAGDLGDGPSAARCEAQKRAWLSHVGSSRERTGPSPVMIFAALSAAAGVAILIVLGTMVAGQPEEKPMAFWVGQVEEQGSAGKWVHAEQGSEVPIRFDNGSRMALEAQSAARVVESTQDKVDVNLSSGKLNADIKGNGRTSWIVNAGPYKVSVLGTEFDVDWNNTTSTLGVSVTRGKVLVQGGHLNEHGIRLVAGKRLIANGLDGSVALESIGAGAQELASKGPEEEAVESIPQALEEEDDSLTETETPSVKVVGAGVGRVAIEDEKDAAWIRLCDERDYKGAVSAAEEVGIDKLVGSLERDDLWKLASAARYAHRPAVSTRVYVAVRERFPGTPRAATSAFMLGRMALDEKASPEEARKWFSVYLDEAPSGPLAEEALGRLMDACDKSGREEEAERRARAYLSRYQDGLFAKLAKSILQE